MVDILPTERASTAVPDVRARMNVPATAFGGGEARGLEQLGGSVAKIGAHWGEIAADDVANQFQDQANKILHGDPDRMVTLPDGTQAPDTGYMGLKGRAALDQRQAYEKRLDDLYKQASSKLPTPDQQFRFSQFSRRYRAVISGQMGNHADVQANAYADEVTKAEVAINAKTLAANPLNPEMVANSASGIVNAYVKRAQLRGAQPGDPIYQAAVNRGWQEAIGIQVSAIAVNDPAKALRIIENNRDRLGPLYDDLANKVRSRAEQQIGRETADWMLTGAPPPAGDDTKAVLRHFEGFKDKAYWDVNHYRAGYGSDTVTRADGSVVPVTADTVVSREDAERDLERRSAISQQAVRQKVGPVFDTLSPQAKASLASVAYNYGEGNIPQTVVDAAKTGDPAQIAKAIRGLSGHNGGVNARRRASEAANVAPGEVAQSTQADLINEVKAKHLPPQAEAAAINRINQSYALQHAAETKRRAEFKQTVDDSVAEALNTGATSNPLPESEFIRHYGPEDGAAKYADYQSNIVYSADRKTVESLSNTQQQQFLITHEPKPGKPGYAYAVSRHNQLVKDVAKIQQQRREDPAQAVSTNLAVQSAMQGVNDNDPSTYKALVDARLTAQEQMGIEPEYRSPITKAEALKLTAPLRTMLPGDEAKVLKDLGTKFQQMFGDQADEAFSYAIRAHQVNAEVAQQAASIVRKLRDGLPLEPRDAAPLDEAKDRAAAERAVQGFPKPTAPGRAPLRVIGNNEGEAPIESVTTGDKPTPPPAAVEFLLKNPGSDQDFDKKYGTGKAKEIREMFPGLQRQ